MGEEKIFTTTDGGITWLKKSKEIAEGLEYWQISDLFFVNDMTGWVVGGEHYPFGLGHIFKTTDGGNSWTEQIVDDTTTIKSIFFTDLNIGWLITSDSYSKRKVFKTTDGGTNWLMKYNGNFLLNYPFFLDYTTGWAVGSNKIFKTTDEGTNWTEYQTNVITLQSIFFINNLLGWAVGGDNQQNGVILKSTDGGINWAQQITDTIKQLNSIYFVDETNGWTVGKDGDILHATDGGESWTRQSSGTKNPLFSTHFIDNNNGWIVGAYKTILRTINGGEQWENVFSPYSDNYWKISFVNSLTGWIFGGSNIILKTTNGGITLIGDEKNVPEVPLIISLSQNYPNPFNPTTKITYAVPYSVMVELKIYNVLGQEIKTIVNEEKQAGIYEVEFNAIQLASGIYFYTISAGDFHQTKKLVLLK